MEGWIHRLWVFFLSLGEERERGREKAQQTYLFRFSIQLFFLGGGGGEGKGILDLEHAVSASRRTTSVYGWVYVCMYVLMMIAIRS